MKQAIFAVLFGNRGFFPASLQEQARSEMQDVLEGLGYGILTTDPAATPHGAVETPEQGRLFSRFLEEHRGDFDGVIVCLPNFGDETGVVEAVRDARVPILIHAYPDELDKMQPERRRDAFCGKFSVMDVLVQYGIPFTALTPHVVHPMEAAFADNLDYFGRLCRVVAGMKRLVVGAIGARTTAFKTVRIDELALQKHGITLETFDLSEVFDQVRLLKSGDGALRAKKDALREYTTWPDVPDEAFDNLARLAVVLDRLVADNGLDAIAVRCWLEMQKQLGISPCVLLSMINEGGLAAACEVDVGNAVTMHALRLATGKPATCLDWNNNYGGEPDKCILFHCGPVPQSLMTGKGEVQVHAILDNALQPGCSWGCNVGRIAPMDFTFGSMLTRDGQLEFYLGEGEFTGDPIPKDYFGCAGTARIENLQEVLRTIGLDGHRHHVSVSPGWVVEPVAEAFERYLGYSVKCV